VERKLYSAFLHGLGGPQVERHGVWGLVQRYRQKFPEFFWAAIIILFP
jgi:hypothetical protein